jgi:hypothetical protein
MTKLTATIRNSGKAPEKRFINRGSSQNLILFIRGKAASGAPSIHGTNQFPKPPIIIGIIIKKIITKAWALSMT